MNKVLSSKALTLEQGAKLASEFVFADYAVRDTNELIALVSLLSKLEEELEAKIAEIAASSGSTELVQQLNAFKSVKKEILKILSNRTTEAEVDDRTLVKIVKDDVVEVVDNGESRYETTEVLDSTTVFITEVKYHFATVEEFNDATGSNKTEEDYYYDVLCKFADLSLLACFKIGGKRLSELDELEINVLEVIEFLRARHILFAIGADGTKLNSLLKIYVDKRNELIGLHYVVKEHISKPKDPTNSQMSLFDDDDTLDVNVLSEGGDADVQEQSEEVSEQGND